MGKKIFMLLILLISIFSVSAGELDNLLCRYGFDEGNGSIAFDNSLYNRDMTGTGTIVWINDSAWGDYSYAPISNYFQTTNLTGEDEEFSVSYWLYYNGSATATQSHFDLQVTGTTFFNIRLNGANNYTQLYYPFGVLSWTTRTLWSQSFPVNNWTHVGLNVNITSNKIGLYINGESVSNTTLAPPILWTNATKTLKVGATASSPVTNWDGNIDEFKMYDRILTDEEMYNLYSTNSLSGNGTPETPVPEEIQETYIITSQSPETNDSVYNNVNFQATTSHLATCQLYIDNKYVTTFEDITAFNYDQYLPELQNHTYFLYCYFMINTTLYYEISDVQTFYVNQYDPNLVTFKIIPEDFEVGDYELWLTSPCLRKGGGVKETSNLPYQAIYNPSGAYFSKVDEYGFASLNLTSGSHEFCLFSGRLIVNEANKTTNYDVVEVNNNLELGTLDIPNNITSYFEIMIDKFTILPKYDPEAWGQTWSSVIVGIILLILGLLIAMSGISLNNGKITIGGVLMILSGLGVSFGGILGVLF